MRFTAKVFKLGINPCVDVPADILKQLFSRAGKKGPIPVRGKLNGKGFRQTMVKYRGLWRLYLNTRMREDAGIGVGDTITVRLEFDTEPRIVPMHPALAPSHQKEILVYIGSLKTQQSIARNVRKVIHHLTNKTKAPSLRFKTVKLRSSVHQQYEEHG